jgi:hypothetical protein
MVRGGKNLEVLGMRDYGRIHRLNLELGFKFFKFKK